MCENSCVAGTCEIKKGVPGLPVPGLPKKDRIDQCEARSVPMSGFFWLPRQGELSQTGRGRILKARPKSRRGALWRVGAGPRQRMRFFALCEKTGGDSRSGPCVYVLCECTSGASVRRCCAFIRASRVFRCVEGAAWSFELGEDRVSGDRPFERSRRLIERIGISRRAAATILTGRAAIGGSRARRQIQR
jgi:hypothetical protein